MTNKTFPAGNSDSQRAVEEEIMPLVDQIVGICKRHDLPIFFNTFFINEQGKPLTVVVSQSSSRPEVSSTAIAHELFGMLLEHGPKFLMEMGRAIYEEQISPENLKVGILRMPKAIDE